MSDLEELRRIAREAQAPVERNGRIDPEAYGANNAFRSLANPAAVLALIERVEGLEQALRVAEAERDALRAQIDAASLSLNRQPGETLEQAAERAMDEVAALLERAVELERFASGFAETVDHDLRAIEQRSKGGMQVKPTGDFVSAPPSVQGRLRWWSERAREALATGKEGAK